MAADKSHLTTGDIQAITGAPDWAVRRAIDALGEAVPRAGLYRLVPRELLPRVLDLLSNQGHIAASAGGKPHAR